MKVSSLETKQNSRSAAVCAALRPTARLAATRIFASFKVSQFLPCSDLDFLLKHVILTTSTSKDALTSCHVIDLLAACANKQHRHALIDVCERQRERERHNNIGIAAKKQDTVAAYKPRIESLATAPCAEALI